MKVVVFITKGVQSRCMNKCLQYCLQILESQAVYFHNWFYSNIWQMFAKIIPNHAPLPLRGCLASPANGNVKRTRASRRGTSVPQLRKKTFGQSITLIFSYIDGILWILLFHGMLLLFFSVVVIVYSCPETTDAN